MDIFRVFHLAVVAQVAYDGLIAEYINVDFPGKITLPRSLTRSLTPRSLLFLRKGSAPRVFIRYEEDHATLYLVGFPHRGGRDYWQTKRFHTAHPDGIDVMASVVSSILPGWIEWERLNDVANVQADRVGAMLVELEQLGPPSTPYGPDGPP